MVDGEWVYAPEQATTTDINGNVCNVLQVEAIESSEVEQLVVESPRESYSQLVPEGTQYSKEPPPLPPQLRVNLLEPRPPPKQPAESARRHAGAIDAAASAGRPVFLDQPKLPPGALPDPTHVVINHLFCNTVRTPCSDAPAVLPWRSALMMTNASVDGDLSGAVFQQRRPGVLVYASTHRHDAGEGMDKFVTTVVYCPDKRPSECRPLGHGDGYIPRGSDGTAAGPRRDSEPNEC